MYYHCFKSAWLHVSATESHHQARIHYQISRLLNCMLHEQCISVILLHIYSINYFPIDIYQVIAITKGKSCPLNIKVCVH
jgi:hypothetical protein